VKRSSGCASTQRGLLLLGVLVALAIVGAMAAVTTQRWAEARRRDAEEELLDVGLQYKQAIESYAARSPAGQRQWPTRLEDLTSDPRFPHIVRHLRRLYPDPLDPERPWGLIRQGNAILGIYSQSSQTPFRTANFEPALRGFEQATSYSEWRFIAAQRTAAAASGASPQR